MNWKHVFTDASKTSSNSISAGVWLPFKERLEFYLSNHILLIDALYSQTVKVV